VPTLGFMSTAQPLVAESESESLAELIGDCRRMARHWEAQAPEKAAAVAPSSLRGITVPAASAHVVDGMAEYGD
jgi:hypothetical protein